MTNTFVKLPEPETIMQREPEWAFTSRDRRPSARNLSRLPAREAGARL